MTSPTVTFNADDYLWYDHLKIALDELPVKVADIDKNYLYYDGKHPKVWLTNKLREMFKELSDQLSENWCESVIDKPLHRLQVTGWIGDNPSQDLEAENIVGVDNVEAIFKDNDLEIGQAEIYRQCRIAGEAFLFVWPDEERESGIDVSLNDARNVWWPKGKHRSKPDRVVKVWVDDDEKRWRATVYYSEVCVRLIGPKVNIDRVMPQVRWFVPDPDDPGGYHGFEQVPVVRFALQEQRRSALLSVIPIQDKINKLEANKMVAAEFGAFRPRALLTEQDIDDDDLKMRPNRVLKLHPGGGEDGIAPTSIWEGSATDLVNYDQSIAEEVKKIFTFASLPRHILVDTNSPVSGDGIEADEGPFTEMLEDHQRSFGASWTDLFELLGHSVKPQWRSVQVRSDKAEADTVKTFTDAGVSLEDALIRYAGWSEDDIKKMNEREITPERAIALANGLATGVALGGVDPGMANEMTGKMFGGKAGATQPISPNGTQPNVNTTA